MPVQVALGVCYAPVPCSYCSSRVSDDYKNKPWMYSAKKGTADGVFCAQCKGYGYMLIDVSHLRVKTIKVNLNNGD